MNNAKDMYIYILCIVRQNRVDQVTVLERGIKKESSVQLHDGGGLLRP